MAAISQKTDDEKSNEQIQALQEKKLRKMLLYAYDHSAYYREAFETAGITADRIGTTPLDHFPTLNKELLMEHYDEIVTDPNIRQSELRSFGERSSDSAERYLGKYHVVHSSGSTGVPDNTSETVRFIRNTTGLIVSDGAQYGRCGEPFIRMNIACSRVVLEDGLSRLMEGIQKYEEFDLNRC